MHMGAHTHTHTHTHMHAYNLESRGLGWRIHGSVEDTKLSTNKQHSLSPLSPSHAHTVNTCILLVLAGCAADADRGPRHRVLAGHAGGADRSTSPRVLAGQAADAGAGYGSAHSRRILAGGA